MVTISHTLSLFSLIPIISASPYRLDSPHAHGFRWLQSLRHRAATPVLPTGWSYTNCYSDPSSSRVLSTRISSTSSNTQDTCVAQCNTQGYTYAGVEYGVECWCGNTLNNPQVTTSCNMACPGDSTQKCGDGNKIGLFTKSTTASAGWTSLGCFVDQDDRTLNGGYYTDSAMTPALCQSKCSTAGYSMAGVEYGTECYCGNSLSKNVGSSSCTSTCGGDSSQICGGSWALNVYQKTASTTTTTTTTTSTRSTMSSTSTTSTSTTSTTSSSTTSSSASASPTWTSVGCIADQSARTLNGLSYSDATSMTPAFCQAKCAAAGYSFAGVEYSKECYCGNTLTNGGTSSSGCTYACAGDSSLICGGNYALNVFKLAGGSTSSSSSSSSSTTSSSSTSSVATTSTTSTSPTSSAVYGWSSVGCIVDQNARTLNAQSYTDTSMTPALCQSKCYAAGYTFAGTEYSSQCYCGNTLTNGGTSSSGCTSTCAGNSSLICGGSWALSVYKYTPSPASSSIASTISSTSSTISTSSAVSSTISSTSSSSSTTSTTSTTSASPSPTYTSLGCYRDSYNRVLSQGQGADTSTRTIQSCFAQCASLGYCYAGLETGSECWCNDSLLTSSDSGSKLSMDQCQMTCTGNSSQYCGGSWSLEIYYDGTKSKCKGPPTTSVVSSSSTTSTTTSTTTTSTQSTSTNGLWYQTNGSNTGKVIIAHVIVGNTYSYTTQQWINEIKMASAQGIDAFALDFGYDSWQAGQMDSAYDAASSSGTGFKMLLSLDFTVLSCSDNSIITTNINKYKNHAAQLKDSSGNMWVQTFDGGNCRSDSQWNSVLRNNGIGIKFVPAFFNDETNTKMKDMFPSINGDFLWGGAWPKGNNVLDWSEDDYRISRSGLSRPPDVYMTTVSPLFFVHYSGRNSIWRSDDHLYARRWEDLFSHRALVDAVQIVTWNDYGESTYIGPIGKDMPSGTNWVTGFDHTPFLQMTGYYAWAFKTGQYPTITSDKIFFWGRPHSMNAVASNDGLGKPTNWNWTSDSLWIVLFSTGSGSLSVTMGSSSSTFAVSAGVNKFTLGLAQASSVTAKLTRNGVQVFSVQGAVTYTGSPSQYNWNYAAAAGP